MVINQNKMYEKCYEQGKEIKSLEQQNAKLVEALERIINCLHIQDGTAYDIATEALQEANDE